jgi:sugar phosphate permease
MFLGVFGIILSLLLYFIVKDCHLMQKRQSSMTFGCVKKGFLQIIKNPFIWINGMIGFCYYFPTSVFAELLGQSYLKTVHNLNSQEATFAITMIFLGWAVGGLFVGWLADRCHLDRTMLGVGGIGAALCIATVLYMPHLSCQNICILLFLFGTFSASEVINYSYARKIGPKAFPAVALGVTNMLVVLGGALCQPLIGWMLDYNWQGAMAGGLRVYGILDYKMSFWILPLGLLIGAILSAMLKKVEFIQE